MTYAVTTFSPGQWKIYGKKFVDSFLQHWPIPLVVFGEGQGAPPGYRGLRELIWYDLQDDPEHQEYCVRYAGHDYNHPTDYARQSVRFCHKVFAYTSAKLPEDGWRIWIDADVVTTAPIERHHMDILCPPDRSVTYLGRKGLMRPGQPMHTECGFMAFNQAHTSVMALLRYIRRLYVTGEMFKLGKYDLHDSAIFDYARKKLICPSKWNNLTPHMKEQKLDAWEESVLHEFSHHNKGIKRKWKAYRNK